MSDDWNRPRPRTQREREGGGYFKGEPAGSNNPGQAHLPPDTDRNGHHGPSGDPRRSTAPDGDIEGSMPDVPRDPVRGEAGRGYGGLSRRGYADRGPGRVFDRGEDYGRGDTSPPTRAGDGSHDPANSPAVAATGEPVARRRKVRAGGFHPRPFAVSSREKAGAAADRSRSAVG